MPDSPISVRAYAYAATFRLRDLGGCFPGAVLTHANDELTARFPDGSAAIAFDFGAVVFFGVDAARRDRTIAELARLYPNEPHLPLTEDFLVEVRPGAPPEPRFDRIYVAELSDPVVSIVGLLLAQSASLDYYDEDVSDILARTARITHELSARGRLSGRVRDLMRFIGGCMQTRSGILSSLALFDKPEATWEEEALDLLYVKLREHLEIDDRFRALEYKLSMIQDNLVLFADVSRQRHSMLLEWGVLLLILLEVVVMMWQILGGGGGGH